MGVCFELPEPRLARAKPMAFEPLRSVESDNEPYNNLDLLLAIERKLYLSAEFSEDELAAKPPRRVEIILEEFSKVNTVLAHIIDLMLNGLEDGKLLRSHHYFVWELWS